MSKDNALAQLDREEKAAKAQKDLGDALLRLQSNRDFKRLVSEGYFRDEAVRLVSLKAHPEMQTPERQSSILLQIDAIGNLQQYFVIIGQQAALAERSLDGIEGTRTAILEEED